MITIIFLRYRGLLYNNIIINALSCFVGEPLHGYASKGRPKTTFVDVLRSDVGLRETRDIAAMMGDADRWCCLVCNTVWF